MPAFPASQIPVRSRRGAGPDAVSCGLAAGARPGLFQGWYCPNDSADNIRTAAAMKLKRKAPAMYYFSGCCGRAASGCGPMAMSVSPFASKTLTILPTGAPFFTGCKATVTGSPALKETRRQPRRSEEHTSELQSRSDLVCRLLLEKKK